MPGYGVLGPDEGGGLLPWSWADERLRSAHNFWLTTSWPDGRPHSMPIWGVWDGAALWFSSGGSSRKLRNIRHDPRCVMTTESGSEAVIVEGSAVVTGDGAAIASFVVALNAKYDKDYTLDFFAPDLNVVARLDPVLVFGLSEANFQGTPTRWEF